MRKRVLPCFSPFLLEMLNILSRFFGELVSSYPPLCCVSGRESRETLASLSSNFSGSWPSFLFSPPSPLERGNSGEKWSSKKNCAVSLWAPDETEAESDCSSITAQKWDKKIASICSVHTQGESEEIEPYPTRRYGTEKYFSANSRDGRGNFLAAKDEKGLRESFFSLSCERRQFFLSLVFNVR